MELYKSPKLVVKHSPVHGFGVFTKEDIIVGELLEECHLYRLESKQIDQIDKGILPIVQQYPIRLPINPFVIVLGYGSIYNHSDSPNTLRVGENNLYKFTAKVNITSGSELFINYFD